MPKGEKDIRELITGRLRTQIDEIWRKAESYHDAQKGDTIQGTLHCKAVEENLGKLIPDSKKGNELKQMHLFLLSAAACLHDIGKVVDDEARGWKSDHGKRSREIVLARYNELGLDRDQAVAVAYIVGTHGDGRIDLLPSKPVVVHNEDIDIIELAAIFRMADMLDATCQRAPEMLSMIKFPEADVPSKWLGRQSSTGWYLEEKDRIILQAVPKKDEVDAAYAVKAMMNEDLSKISPYLRLHGYPCEFGDLDIGDVFLVFEVKKEAVHQRPFPGMAFYTKDEAEIFKGRDNEIDNLLAVVSNWPIALLVGESGAGKTSLVHAGLFPRLETMQWEFVWTRPFDNPCENIKKIIWSAFFQGPVRPDKSLLDIMKQAAEKCEPRQLLVVMDQFEDVLRCEVQEILQELSLSLMAVQTGTVIPNIRILISFREDASVRLNSRLLKKITGSAQQFPSVEVERLTREAAKEALLSGLERAGIGLDSRQDQGQKRLIDQILDDIQKGDDRLYPPYIQMVGERLCKSASKLNPVITTDMYVRDLGGADNIIGRYLFDRLDEFGPHKDKAEKVLISLTSSIGRKAQKSMIELSEETETAIDELREIMDRMVDLRMAWATSDCEFEIRHDYLGRIIDEKLVSQEERTTKFLREQLDSAYQNYKMHCTPLTSCPFLASLYRNRRRIQVTEREYPLILCTCLYSDVGLGWYWLRHVDEDKLYEMIKAHVSHPWFDIRCTAMDMFVRVAKPEHLIELLYHEDAVIRTMALDTLGEEAVQEHADKIVQMLDDQSRLVRSTALEVVVRTGRPRDKTRIIGMLSDEDPGTRRAALAALGEIAGPEESGDILRMFKDKRPDVRAAALRAFGSIPDVGGEKSVLEMMDDEDRLVREAAAEALVRITKPENRHNIFRTLTDQQLGEWVYVTEAFTQVVQSRDRPMVLEMLGDKGPLVKLAGALAFLKIAELKDKTRVIEIVRQKELFLDEVAVTAFVRLTRPENRGEIIELVEDEDPNVKRAAKIAFAKIAGPADKVRIAQLLDDASTVVRRAARIAFARVATAQDSDRVIKMLHNEDRDIRSAAADAFVRITSPKDSGKLIEMIHSQKSELRNAAVEAFVKTATTDERVHLLDLLADGGQGWSEKQMSLLRCLSQLDRRFYCPFSQNCS